MLTRAFIILLALVVAVVGNCLCRLPKLYLCESCLTYIDSQVSLDRHTVCCSSVRIY